MKQCESVGRRIVGDSERQSEVRQSEGVAEGGSYCRAELWRVGLGEMKPDGV